MSRKLSGWHRLWVLVSVIYFIVVAFFIALTLPWPETTLHSPEIIKRMSPGSKAKLSLKGGDEFAETDESATRVEMPNGTILPFKKGLTNDEMSAAAREYWRIVQDVATERRLRLIGIATVSWLIPCLALYGLGWAIGWVISGFRGKTSGDAP